MTKHLTTVPDVIEELGGTNAVRSLTKRDDNPSTVLMWKKRKKFPAHTYPVLQAALRARGVTASDELWGVS